MGAYYDADRAYVFELNAERTHASNTCEWCREGVLAEIGNLQNIPLEGMECWFEAFEEEFFISGAAGGAQERLNYFCRHLAAPECTEELLDFVNLSTLNQRMEHTRIVSKQYKSTLIPAPEDENATSWRECSFIEGDRQLFDRVRTVAGVNALLANKKAYYFNYRVFRNGTVQYFQCQLVKPNRDRNEFVVAFKNVDEEKKQELAQQRKLEEAFAALEQVNESLAGVRRLPCAACGGQ